MFYIEKYDQFKFKIVIIKWQRHQAINKSEQISILPKPFILKEKYWLIVTVEDEILEINKL